MNQPSDPLLLIKTRGPLLTGDIARLLGVSRQAARMQMEKLAAEGLVEADDARGGIGRPRRCWSLTDRGHARFPDRHAQITVELIEAMREEFGTKGLERLIARREAAAAEGYERSLRKATTLPQRLAGLARLRTEEGYMAEWQAQDDGSFLLLENHCPICAAAEACQGFCRSELLLFRSLLAPATVERTDHILAGARRCAYRVTPAASLPDASARGAGGAS